MVCLADTPAPGSADDPRWFAAGLVDGSYVTSPTSGKHPPQPARCLASAGAARGLVTTSPHEAMARRHGLRRCGCRPLGSRNSPGAGRGQVAATPALRRRPQVSATAPIGAGRPRPYNHGASAIMNTSHAAEAAMTDAPPPLRLTAGTDLDDFECASSRFHRSSVTPTQPCRWTIPGQRLPAASR